MLLRYKKYIILLITAWLMPILVLASSSSDDTSYTAVLEDGYEYGNVTSCNLNVGTAYYDKVKVNDITVCKTTESDAQITSIYCDDDEMESFKLDNITGSDGETYYGYGCRKLKDESKIEWEKKDLYIGYSDSVANSTTHTCSIIEGDSAAVNHLMGSCYITGKTLGPTKIKSKENKTKITTYYEINVIPLNSKIIDLDQDYDYGSVDECDIGWAGDKVSFDGLTFCASNREGYNYGYDKVTCQNEDYDFFQVAFTSNGESYKGFGCRKIKDESKREYVKKELYLGYSDSVGDYFDGYTCSIIEGDSAVLGKDISGKDNCVINSVKEGVTKIKSKNNSTGLTTYYEYNVIPLNSELSDLDGNYYYGSVDYCSIGEKGYSYGDEVKFEGLTFCASSLLGYNYQLYKVTCKDKGYEPFKVAFSSNGTSYKGYGCRILKSDVLQYEEPDHSYIPKLNTTDLCENEGVKDSLRIVGNIIAILKYIVPLIIIVLGMVDFAKAIMSNDEKAISKAAGALVRRLIAGVAVFLIPTLIAAILNITISTDIDNNTTTIGDTSFGKCTSCLFDLDNCQ